LTVRVILESHYKIQGRQNFVDFGRHRTRKYWDSGIRNYRDSGIFCLVPFYFTRFL